MLNVVIEKLLTKNKIIKEDIFESLENIKKKKIDFGDVYIQSKFLESWYLENGIIKKSTFFNDNGIGIRVVKNFSTGFSYTNFINQSSLLNTTQNSCELLLQKCNFKSFVINKNGIKKSLNSKCNKIKIFNSIEIKKKIDLIHFLDVFIRKQDARVVDVSILLIQEKEHILIGSTDSLQLSSEIRPTIYISISVVVEENGIREKGNSGGSHQSDLNYFLEKNDQGEVRIEFWGKEAVRKAILSLFAKSSPSGTFPVILGSGWPGILFHEAVGHGLEGDFIRKKTSIFSDKIGKKVASNLCTIIDDGTLKKQRGSIIIDDEGSPSKKNILVKNGILKKFLQDKLNARLMGVKPTGNGRRESYSFVPLPRMTNTYLSAGNSTVQEMIESVEYGIYATNFSGGEVDITSGNFVFKTSEAYLIKKGKIYFPIKRAMLSGSGVSVMNSISMVGKDLKFDDGLGVCGKDGQMIPVSVGQPTIKVDKLIVGGFS